MWERDWASGGSLLELPPALLRSAEKCRETVLETIELLLRANEGEGLLDQLVRHFDLAEQLRAIALGVEAGDGVHLVGVRRDREVSGLLHDEPLDFVAAAVSPIHHAFVHLLGDDLCFHGTTLLLVGGRFCFTPSWFLRQPRSRNWMIFHLTFRRKRRFERVRRYNIITA